MPIGDSELILNPDGSIYHLNLLPEDIATTIITVGDPNRVRQVSKFFDSIELQKEKREFITHTGHYQGKRISVISTGIGTDNIDIVFNELDALANIDFKTREVSNWLNFSLMGFGLAYRAFYASFFDNWIFFVSGLLGFILFFVFYYFF